MTSVPSAPGQRGPVRLAAAARTGEVPGGATVSRWLVLVWRLPTGGSSSRVSMWRALRKLGAIGLTPGAAALPWSETLQEQVDWLAQEVDEQGGDAFVLTVDDLVAGDRAKVVARGRQDRAEEYDKLRADALAFLRRAPEHPTPDDPDTAKKVRTERELVALQRRFQRIRARDWFDAPGRREAAQLIDRCLAFRLGISRRLSPVTDPHEDTEG